MCFGNDVPYSIQIIKNLKYEKFLINSDILAVCLMETITEIADELYRPTGCKTAGFQSRQTLYQHYLNMLKPFHVCYQQLNVSHNLAAASTVESVFLFLGFFRLQRCSSPRLPLPVTTAPAPQGPKREPSTTPI